MALTRRPQPLRSVCQAPPDPVLCQQEQMEDMRKKEEHLEKEMAEVSVQNKRLADPLQKARDEMNEMQKKLGNYERDKQILVVSLHLNSSPASAPSPGPRRGGRPVKAGSGELRPSFL